MAKVFNKGKNKKYATVKKQDIFLGLFKINTNTTY